MIKSNKFMIPLFAFFVFFNFDGYLLSADVWEIEPDIPTYDPQWGDIDRLWNSSNNIDNINKIISNCYQLKKRYPDKADPLLWMAWAYQQKALYGDQGDRKNLLKRAVGIAKKSYKIQKNPKAFMILISASMAYKDIDEIRSEHAGWIKDSVPMPMGRELPELNRYPEWKLAVKNWDMRVDIRKARTAVDLFRKMAESKKGDLYAQIWASRGYYYLGRIHSLENREKSIEYYKQGYIYGKRAVEMNPGNVPANFWCSVNLGSSIEFEPVYKKVMMSKEISGNIMACCRKNPVYYYCGPVMVAAGAISKENEITRNIMEIFGYGLGDILVGLEIAEISYPTYYNIPLCRAEVYYNTGRKDEAKKLLKLIMGKDPDRNRLHAAENHIAIRMAGDLLKKMGEH